MNARITLLALLVCVGCYSGKVSLGACNQQSDCKVSGSTCENHVCTYACPQICGAAEACINAQCIALGPEVKSVMAPNTWSNRNQRVTVTAVLDGTKTNGVTSAALQITGQPDIPGVSGDSGPIRTFSFTLPGSVQSAGSETPVLFQVVGVDPKGEVTPPPNASGSGQLLIDGIGPKVTGVTIVNGIPVGTGGQQTKWFARSSNQTIDAVAMIQDGGSGVDASTLSLTLLSNGTRIDTGAPVCNPVAGKLTCHFAIAPGTVPLPSGATQGLVRFAVSGKDKAGNDLQVNTAAVGIDGKAPIVTFTVDQATSNPTTAYPNGGADCTPTDAIATTTCGHDGAHFWRSGDGANYTFKFSATDSFASPDDVGSGIDTQGGTCVIAGTPTCTVTYDANLGRFTFPAELGAAAFTSAPDGTGTVDVSVQVKDAVGNVSAAMLPVRVAVTRLKWARKIAIATSISGTPVLPPGTGQVIFSATVPANNDSIYALNTTDGSLAWRTGGTVPSRTVAPVIPSVTGNLAVDTSASMDTINHPTPVLYAASGIKVFAMHFTSTGVDKYCSQSASTKPLVGSPIIFGGGASAYAVAAAQDRLVAFQTQLDPAGGGCLSPSFYPFTIPAPSPLFGPPSANMNTVYWGYDNSSPGNPTDLGLKSINFTAGAFDTSSAKTTQLGFAPTASGVLTALSPASDILFGVSSQATFYDYAPDIGAATGLSHKWKSAGLANVFSQPLVSDSVVYGSTKALYAFKVIDGGPVWASPAATGASKVSAPTFAKGAFFVADDSGPSIGSFTLSGAKNWQYSGTSALPISGIATEATLGSDGILYFGDGAGNLFAIFSDATPIVPGAGDWPRTGFDNCNSNHSNNQNFRCQ